MKINEKINKDVALELPQQSKPQKKKDEQLNSSTLSMNMGGNNDNESQTKITPVIDKESNMIYMLKIVEKSLSQ